MHWPGPNAVGWLAEVEQRNNVVEGRYMMAEW